MTPHQFLTDTKIIEKLKSNSEKVPVTIGCDIGVPKKANEVWARVKGAETFLVIGKNYAEIYRHHYMHGHVVQRVALSYDISEYREIVGQIKNKLNTQSST